MGYNPDNISTNHNDAVDKKDDNDIDIEKIQEKFKEFS